MERPAPAKPLMIVAIGMPAVTSAENTMSNRVPAVTGIARPVVMPLAVVPTVITPATGGASVTVAPATGVKMSLGGGGLLYSCAVMVTVVPMRLTAAPML